MVDYFVSDMRWYTKTRHTCDDRAAKIVRPPFGRTRELIQIFLCEFERLEILAACCREYQAVLWLGFDNLPDPLGLVNQVSLGIFGSCEEIRQVRVASSISLHVICATSSRR
jgi:hypothetical protein